MTTLNVNEVRRRREALRMTQEEAASRAGLAGGRQRWCDIESGRKPDPQLSTVIAVANALECSIDDLLVPGLLKRQKRNRPSGAAGSQG